MDPAASSSELTSDSTPSYSAPQAALCLSGGMDSTSLLLHMLAAGHPVQALSLDYGQRHRIELDKLKANLAYLRQAGYSVPHHHVDLSGLAAIFHSALTDPDWAVPLGFYAHENMKQTVVPNRNAIFASIAYGFALSLANISGGEVWLGLGVHSGDHAIYPDCRPDFYTALIKAFELGNWDSHRVRMYLPYLEGDKVSILKDAQVSVQKLGLDFDQVFRNTWTSYQPDDYGRADGRTGSDVERILAFAALGLVDPIEYRQPWEEVLAYAQQAQREFEAEQS